MATDSKIKLTKFKSSVTIVTADFANSIFGGLYGSGESVDLDPDDPRIRGHIHDGQAGDGHARKIHLVDHVEDQLLNINLADDAVTKRNVFDTTVIEDAIPEYRVDGGTTYYYLDLRTVRSDFTFQEVEDPAGDGSENRLVRLRKTTFDGTSESDIEDGRYDTAGGFDFVFGSHSLEDLADPAGTGDVRFQFDKSNGSFRAGSASSDHWDEANRGTHSVAMGRDTVSSGVYSTVSGGFGNEATGSQSSISGGLENKASGNNSSISGGFEGEVSGNQSSIVGGLGNDVSGNNSFIGGGESNLVSGEYASVVGGLANHATASKSVVSGGTDNKAEGESTGVFSGTSNNVDNLSKNSSIVGGEANVVSSSEHSLVGGGIDNRITGNNSCILGGKSNLVEGSESLVVGGQLNHTIGVQSAILGGMNNAIDSDVSIITGGMNNKIESKFSLISGGVGNWVYPGSDTSNIIGGMSNYVNGQFGSILGSSTSQIDGQASCVVGGLYSKVLSDYSVIIGSSNGQAADGHSIGDEYTGVTGALAEGKSDFSGIFGGYNNRVTGGGRGKVKDPENNFVIATSKSFVGGAETPVYNCQVIGGFNSEITAVLSTGNPVDPTEHKMDSSQIFGGMSNAILMGSTRISCNVLYSTIFGGVLNGINHIFETPNLADLSDPLDPWNTSPWWNHLTTGPGDAEYGTQTSTVIGGVANSITNSKDADFKSHSLYSSILGGQNNVITSSYGSVILGGGAFVDTNGHGSHPSPEPLYDLVDRHYPNIIAKGHHSVVLSGSSNFVSPHLFPFGITGPYWIDPKTHYTIMLPEPAFVVAQGRESYGYLYGQKVQASGGHSQDKFVSQNFLTASLKSPPGSDFKVLLGSPEYNNTTRNQPGTAQASSFTFHGSWDYDKAEIDPQWNPSTALSYFEFRSYLDGGAEEALLEPNRGFVPRYPGSYSVNISGALSYSIPTGSDYANPSSPDYGFGAEHHVISFTYSGYIVFDPSGAGRYGGQLSNVVCSDPSASAHPLTLFTSSGVVDPKTDFLIGFCPEKQITSAGLGALTTPDTAYSSSSMILGEGSWEPPQDIPGLASDSWPPKFCIYVVNKTGDPAIVGVGSGSAKERVGESLVAKVDITENLLFLGKFA